jgi:hypothetical protein
MDNQVIPLIPEEDPELEANEARNVATSILDEILNRVVQTKAEVRSLTLMLKLSACCNGSYICIAN